MKHLVAWLMCFLLAFPGGISANADINPCLMEQTAELASAMNDMAPANGDCCNDAETAARTGKLCKTDLPCSASGACVASSALAWLAVVMASERWPSFTALTATFARISVWRPPSTL